MTKEVPYLRLVPKDGPPPESPKEASQPPLLRTYDNTMIREFKGPFAHTRAMFVFEDVTDWGSFELVSWARFSWREPSTWFYARLEAVTNLTIPEWNRMVRIMKSYFGRRWYLHHEHRTDAVGI